MDGVAPTLVAPDTRRRLADGKRQDGSRTDRIPIVAFAKSRRAQSVDDDETWVEGEVAPTLNDFDHGDVRATALALGSAAGEDELLPLGLDSHRYRCCGNGVVSQIPEWIGGRLAEWLETHKAPGVSVGGLDRTHIRARSGPCRTQEYTVRSTRP